jgi:hypothetical protein
VAPCRPLQRYAARTEDDSMTLPDAISTPKVNNFAHKALKALGFVNLNVLQGRHHSSALPCTADLPATTHSPISAEDWDPLFRAVQLRLRTAVGDRLASAPAPQADDAAGKIQVAVLECISAMEQLHKALTHERQGRAGETAAEPCVGTDPVPFTERLG